MNILITGANGFIGRRLSSRLIALGHQVSGLSLRSPSDTSLGFKDYYQQDITKPFSLKGHFDFVIHLAAYNITNIGAKDGDLYTAVNVEGTKHLLQAVNMQRFVYLSTAKVYTNEGLPIAEDSPLLAQGAYAQSKLKAEEVCSSFVKTESLVILRSVNVIGWGQAPKAVLPVFFQKAKANQPLDIISSAQTLMQFVYVEDLIDAIEALIHRETLGGIFNIAHEQPVNLEQLARTIISMTHSSSVLNISKDSPEALFSPVICRKAYQDLGWKAKTGLARILELYGERMPKAPKKIKILICGILPPPNFGHSIIYKMLMASSFPDAFETKFLNMQFWTYGTHKKVTIEKIFKMVKYYVIYTGTLLFWRPKYVLYNSSFYRMPYLKDLLFCSTGIILGSKVVFHDLGQYVRELDESLTSFKKSALRWMLKNMGGSIIMGEKVRQDYEGLADPAKIFVVPGTAEDSREIKVDAPKDSQKINILYFSHMSRLKGVYTAFEAMSLILKEHAETIVTFGGPMEDQEVKSRLEELQDNYPQRVCYMGYVEDVAERTKIFRQADIFIFPTLRDVFGLVLLHAMAEGLPIVASREGTVPEIVPDGTNALLVEKGDAKALADKVLLLVEDRPLRTAMGQANRRRFEETYTLEKYGESMIKAFQQMEALYG